jgi:hypothetical protein
MVRHRSSEVKEIRTVTRVTIRGEIFFKSNIRGKELQTNSRRQWMIWMNQGAREQNSEDPLPSFAEGRLAALTVCPPYKHGVGSLVSPKAVEEARKMLTRVGSAFKTDVFPGSNGGVLVVVFRPDNLSIRGLTIKIEPDLSIKFNDDHEHVFTLSDAWSVLEDLLS